MPATIDSLTHKADAADAADPLKLRLLTLREVAGILRLSLEAVRHRIDTRAFPFYRVGPGPSGQIRVRACDLEAYLAKGHVPANEPMPANKSVKPARRPA